MTLSSKFTLCDCSMKVGLDTVNILSFVNYHSVKLVSRKRAGVTIEGENFASCQAPEA